MFTRRAHVPLIHGPDGAKLSKRHGAQSVGEFEEMGYLAEGMRNYLARLGAQKAHLWRATPPPPATEPLTTFAV